MDPSRFTPRSRQHPSMAPWAALVALTACLAVGTAPALAQTTFGALSNFDVFNDTGQECHGFEIELEGLSSADVTYTFGGTYLRYGTPVVVDGPGRVYVRYQSPYDAVNHVFTQATPQAPAVITPTNGHACFAGGSGNYLTSGCEHFGVGLRGNPTNTIYRWLVADPVIAGNLQPAGTKVSIPAPIWNVNPPPAPGPPVVQAVLPAEPPEVVGQWGEAKWVKVFVTESPEPADLHNLVTDDPAVPQEEAETEMEWVLLQARPDGTASELINEKQMGAGNASVTRRYEFYAYTGAYDAENHEAQPVHDPNPDPAPGDVGNYLGAQMAALNLVAPPPAGPLALAVSPLPTGELGVPYDVAVVTGGVPAYTINVTKGRMPAGLILDPTTGRLSGTPDSPTKMYSFTIEATDSLGAVVTGTLKVKTVKGVDVTTQNLKAGKVGKSYSAAVKAARGTSPYTWELTAGSLPDGLGFDAATGVVSGVPTTAGTVVLTFEVTDSLGGKAEGDVSLTIK